jgi:hypothetical protein
MTMLKPFALGLSVLALTACGTSMPQDLLNTNSGAGNQKATVNGSLIKGDGSPATNATVVLIREISGGSQDVASTRTNGSGNYEFKDVIAGEYRVAYVVQSEDQRKRGDIIFYTPSDNRTTDNFGFISTGNFRFDGNSQRAFQVPQINIGWRSQLIPNGDRLPMNSAIRFSWAAAPNARSYNVDIRDSNNNPFYKSPLVDTTSFTWSDLKGNQGSYVGQSLKAGDTYYFLVNALFDDSSSGPAPVTGGTTTAKFVMN